MEQAERQREMDRFYSVGQILSLQPGQNKRFVTLTDFDRFRPVIVHRTSKGRVYCATTKDAMERNTETTQRCGLCDKGNPRVALAAVSIWNVTDKVRQLALLSGPKKGNLHTLMTIFNTLGNHTTCIAISREGSGQQTTYPMVPVASEEVVIPEQIVPFTDKEIMEITSAMLKEREGDAEW